MRFIHVSCVALLLLLSLVPVGALACSCAPPADPQTALEQADVVLAGRVVGLQIVAADADEAGTAFPIEDVLVTLSVSALWKWPDEMELPDLASATLSVRTAFTCCVCGYPFALGDTYLVYAAGDVTNLRTSLCTRTARFEDAQEDVAALGAALLTAQPPASMQQE